MTFSKDNTSYFIFGLMRNKNKHQCKTLVTEYTPHACGKTFLDWGFKTSAFFLYSINFLYIPLIKLMSLHRYCRLYSINPL